MAPETTITVVRPVTSSFREATADRRCRGPFDHEPFVVCHAAHRRDQVVFRHHRDPPHMLPDDVERRGVRIEVPAETVGDRFSDLYTGDPP